jgi:hypothetical protein
MAHYRNKSRSKAGTNLLANRTVNDVVIDDILVEGSIGGSRATMKLRAGMSLGETFQRDKAGERGLGSATDAVSVIATMGERVTTTSLEMSCIRESMFAKPLSLPGICLCANERSWTP